MLIKLCRNFCSILMSNSVCQYNLGVNSNNCIAQINEVTLSQAQSVLIIADEPILVCTSTRLPILAGKAKSTGEYGEAQWLGSKCSWRLMPLVVT